MTRTDNKPAAFHLANRNGAIIVRTRGDDFTATYANVELANMAADVIEGANAGFVFRMGVKIGVCPN